MEDGTGLVPSGAAIDPNLGLFTWRPGQDRGPAVFTFDAVVTDTGVRSDRETIRVQVNEPDVAFFRDDQLESILAFTGRLEQRRS